MWRELFSWMNNKKDDDSIQMNGISPQNKIEPELLTFPSSADLTDAEVVYSYGGINNSGLLMPDFTDDERLKVYREISKDAIASTAIEEIVNSVLVFSGNNKVVRLEFSADTKLDEKTQKQIIDEFDHLVSLLNFRKNGYQYVKDWYIDGRLFFHKLLDKNDVTQGIKALVQIDPNTIKKLKDIDVSKYSETGLVDLSKIREYFIYKPRFSSTSGIPIYGSPSQFSVVSANAIASSDSGLYSDGRPLSYLDKAIVPYNNLKLLEESIIIYRVARAPERKAFYIDVNGLPPTKANEYMNQQMTKFRTGLKFDRLTGKLDGKQAALSIVEDYWFPRRNGNATEVQNIEGGTMLNNIEDVDYFYNQYIQSLHVPKSRLTADAASSLFGAGAEITRDEYRFLRFIDKLQQQFSTMFYDILKTQLICKNIIDDDDWNDVGNDIKFKYENDNAFFRERKLTEINSKMDALGRADAFVGKYYTKDWVMHEILDLSQAEIDALKSELTDNSQDEEPADDE